MTTIGSKLRGARANCHDGCLPWTPVLASFGPFADHLEWNRFLWPVDDIGTVQHIRFDEERDVEIFEFRSRNDDKVVRFEAKYTEESNHLQILSVTCVCVGRL